ncbi:fungal-specific transcription factor domain-containing protein [Penicillium atrosanguineum]|uniref:fungal-specific transcription factor domain-containing protein n=1 Tax=Penicillium atrosanguineum TaxID=1132637 RepID=UPI00238D643C|nr:fungal-specific transcription factor domain-containing protein [Penicillium atrosanguineum]KAJ5310286.1 fungal-specific transcription factor domain-containing protein [Penicillium atrosanguineum]
MGFTSGSCDYFFFRIPKTEEIHISAQKYRDLRLKALKSSPGSFSSTYEIESAFTEADWINILTAPDREIFICAATPLNQESSDSGAVWIGQVTLRGPLSLENFILPPESGEPPQKSDAEEERWQMLSLFALPEHRGNGLGASLCQNALDYLRTCRSSPLGVQVRLIIKPENHVTVKLYQRLGFSEAGLATLAEALIVNGDQHLLPEDTSGPKYNTRAGLIMIYLISRS